MGKSNTAAKTPRSQKNKSPIQEIKKFNTRLPLSQEQLEELRVSVKMQCEDCLLLEEYVESIIGYDYHTNAVVYDGNHILNKMADESIMEAIKNGDEVYEPWDHYYEAVEYFEYNTLRGLEMIALHEEKPMPIFLMRFDD
jgi:hypothetical protein